MVSDVVSIDETLANAMTNSNDIMLDVIENFSNIHDLHTCSKMYIEAEIEKRCSLLDQTVSINAGHIEVNRKKIDEMERIVKTPVGRPKNNTSLSPCLDVS